jgi:hypothetical protein
MTCDEGTEGEHRYNSTLSLTSARDGGVNATPQPLYPRERDPVPIVQEAGWAPGPVWTGAEYLASTGTRSPDRPARSESLHRLRYSGSRSSRKVFLIIIGRLQPNFKLCSEYV